MLTGQQNLQNFKQQKEALWNMGSIRENRMLHVIQRWLTKELKLNKQDWTWWEKWLQLQQDKTEAFVGERGLWHKD